MFIAKIQHIIDPTNNLFSVNIFISITGFLTTSSLLIKKTKHKIKVVKQIRIKLEKNQSLLSPSSKNINKDIRLVANNKIPL